MPQVDLLHPIHHPVDRETMCGHLHNHQARLEVGIVVLDFLNLQSFIITMFLSGIFRYSDLKIPIVLESFTFSSHLPLEVAPDLCSQVLARQDGCHHPHSLI